MQIPFVKMHGAGNDFVVIDHREPFLPEDTAVRARLFRRMCDRRRGIGADGVLLVERDPVADFLMRYHNADGGIADYCGNGARCLARRAFDLGLGHDGVVRFRTAMGLQEAHRSGGRIEVHVGAIAGPGTPLVLEADGRRFTGLLIRAGVPHFVTAVERVEDVPIGAWAPALRHHPALDAEGANVDFVAPVAWRAPVSGGPEVRLAAAEIAMRTWERGVEGETLACGSGAIASALHAAAAGAPSPVTVHTAGGDELIVKFRVIPEGWDVSLAGPSEVAYTGSWMEHGDAVPGPPTHA